ncbi:MAG: hypothetical protein GTN49_09225 [candidate division Zixibacteria bacterium]|nr:hypothetical protein [candidate division Zixibacteria bacterium]
MKGILSAAFAAALAVAPARAALGDVVSSFRALSSELRGLARSDTVLFALCYTSPNVVYRFHPVTGSVYGWWNTPRPTKNRGLAFSEGGRVWVGCFENDFVYDCAGATGSVRASWSAGHDPYGIAPHCTGDGGRGTTALFVADSQPNYIWRHNISTGSILSSFRRGAHWDIAYDHRNRIIWVPTEYGDTIFGVSTSGSVASSFKGPADSPTGAAYHGQYLFIGCANGYVYRVHCPGPPSATPASLGKVKALYR